MIWACLRYAFRKALFILAKLIYTGAWLDLTRCRYTWPLWGSTFSCRLITRYRRRANICQLDCWCLALQTRIEQDLGLATYGVNYKSLNCIEAMSCISSSSCLSESRPGSFPCHPRYILRYISRFFDGILIARGVHVPGYPCAFAETGSGSSSWSCSPRPWPPCPGVSDQRLDAPCTHRATLNVKFYRGCRSNSQGWRTFAFMNAQHCYLRL